MLIKAFLFLYAISLSLSLAGMEFFSALIMLSGLVYLVNKLAFRRSPIHFIHFYGDKGLWIFFFAVLAGSLFASHLTAEEKIEAIGSARFIPIFYALIFSILYVCETNKAFFTQLLRLFTIILGLVCVYGVIQFFSGWDLVKPKPYDVKAFQGTDINLYRVKGFFTNTMTYSYAIGMLVCLATPILLKTEALFKDKRVRLALVTIMMLSLLMTFTRALWISLFLASTLMIWMYRPKAALSFALATVLAFGVLVASSSAVRNRFMGIIQLDGSNLERLKIWRVHFEMAKDHPIFGVGYEQHRSLIQDYNVKIWGHKWRPSDAHNTYLHMATGTGLVGLLGILFFFAGGFYLAYRLWRISGPEDHLDKAIAVGSMGAQALCHIGGMSEAIFVDRESNHAFLFVLAITLCCYYFKNNEASLNGAKH